MLYNKNVFPSHGNNLMQIRHKVVSCSLSCLLFSVSVQADTEARFFYSPALHSEKIAFVHGDEIWLVKSSGGAARKLTDDGESKSNLTFSSDGSKLAYSARINRNVDVYTINIGDSVIEPERQTWHPAIDLAWGWDSANNVYFSSGRSQWNQGQHKELFKLVPGSGLPQHIPVGKVSAASLSVDDRYLAMAPAVDSSNIWKRYRGGTAMPLWIVDRNDFSHIEIPHSPATETLPRWDGDSVFFRSDRSGLRAIHEYDVATKQVTMVTKGFDTDIDSFDAQSGRIAFVSEGYLHVWNRGSDAAERLSVYLGEHAPQNSRGEAAENNVLEEMHIPVLSPDGNTVAFEAHGDIFVARKDQSSASNLTLSPGFGDRDPVWAPDGRYLAYLSDRGGDYAYYVHDTANPTASPRVLPLGKAGYSNAAVFSPDGRRIAYIDDSGQPWWANIDDGEFVPLALQSSLHSTPVWSKNSNALFLLKLNSKSGYSAIVEAVLDTGNIRVLSHPIATIDSLAISANGDVLHFLASSTAGPLMTQYDFSKVLYQDSLNWSAYALDVNSGVITRHAVSPRNYSKLHAFPDGRLLLSVNETYALWGDPESLVEQGEEKPHSYLFDLQSKTETPLQDISRDYSVASKAAVLLVATENGLTRIALPVGGHAVASPFALDEAIVPVDDVAESLQIYLETWRSARDFFHDPGMHGTNWNDAGDYYRAWLKQVHHKGDLYFVMGKLLGELDNSHINVDPPNDQTAAVADEVESAAMLGADVTFDDCGFRVSRVLHAPFWSAVTSPLPASVVGRCLTTVNGIALNKNTPLHQALTGLPEGRLSLAFSGTEAEADITVVIDPLSPDEEKALRYRDWVERNRAWVDEQSGGRVAYLHQPDTSGGGLREFIRYFYPQSGKEAIILDERFNDGGADPDFQLDVLGRTPFLLYGPRDMPLFPSPNSAIAGPKVMLINAEAGSGGDVYPYQFKRRNLGTVIGTRTWGGVNGGFRGVMPAQKIDGGEVGIPDLTTNSPEGTYILENAGMTPDIEVEYFPVDYASGRDPQLARGVTFLLEKLDASPSTILETVERVNRAGESRR